MCYSIYAWHSIIMVEMIPPDTSRLQDMLRLSFPYLAITIVLSALSYRYIEFGHRRDWKSLFLLRNSNPDELIGAGAARRAESKPVASS
jgi:peptidoglycan/LPS O-acetylase OafA/YrhL